METVLTFHCPHCQHQYKDELELLEPDEPHDFRCENCTKTFTIQFKECSACAAETLFYQIALQPHSSTPQRHCSVCGKPFE